MSQSLADAQLVSALRLRLKAGDKRKRKNTKAEALVERSEERWWSAELHRLRGVLLTAMGADAALIEDSFCAAISTAKQQKSVFLEKRAAETYAKYRRQK